MQNHSRVDAFKEGGEQVKNAKGLPWVWIPFDHFLPILAPSVTIIKKINLTSCLHNYPLSWSWHMSAQ